MRVLRCLDEKGALRQAAELPDGRLVALEGDLFSSPQVTDETIRETKRLFPLVPKSILGIGANYLKESETERPNPYPTVFFKCHNALQNPGDPVELPRIAIVAEQAKYEGELAVVLGKSGKNIPENEAMDYVYGYTIANDMSAGDWQRERVGHQWCKGKGFDTFLPLGPVLVTKDEIPDPKALRIVTRISGTVEQDESVSRMCFSVEELIAFLSAGHTVNAGDIILTGTPAGARPIGPGETVEITIDPIGTLTNPVIAEAG